MTEKIKQDLKEALLSHDILKVSTLRLLVSELNNTLIARGHELTEVEIISVIQREIKKRKEASAAFKKAGREDQATKEESEAQILEQYLPAQMPDAELVETIKQVIKDTTATSLKDMGKVIAEVLSRVGQKAQGGKVSTLVREQLS